MPVPGANGQTERSDPARTADELILKSQPVHERRRIMRRRKTLSVAPARDEPNPRPSTARQQ